MSDKPMSVEVQQLIALCSVVANLLDVLRQKGLIPRDEINALFTKADTELPELALPHGSRLIATLQAGLNNAFPDPAAPPP